MDSSTRIRWSYINRVLDEASLVTSNTKQEYQLNIGAVLPTKEEAREDNCHDFIGARNPVERSIEVHLSCMKSYQSDGYASTLRYSITSMIRGVWHRRNEWTQWSS